MLCIIGKLARFRIVGRNTVTGTDPKFPVVSGNYRIDIIVAQPLDGRQPLHNAFFFVKATKTSTESIKIHRIVEQESKAGKQIVIIGNEKHPEVEGIKGWSVSPVYIVDSIEKAQNLELDRAKEVVVVSQTTFNYNKFQELVEIINKKSYNITIKNTICNATEERQTEARDIARKVSAMIVIGDKSSSNTRKLYEICKGECEDTFYIQTLRDLNLNDLRFIDSIGITAGASTPNNIIEEVYTNVREFCRDVS